MEGLIHLIIWLSQTRVKRSGSVTKRVRCENCTLDYEYEMRRTVKLQGETAKEVLDREAERQLRKQLAQESDPGPCPSCGWYQQHMIDMARRHAMRNVPTWVVFLVAVTALSLTLAFVLALPPQRFGSTGTWVRRAAGAVGGMAGLVILVFIVRRLHRRIAYNPNAARWRNQDPHQ
jgi:hypothetical protein